MASRSLRFRDTEQELLSDAPVDLNQRNKDKLRSLSQSSGSFRDSRACECILLITKQLKLDPLVGYHAMELLQRFLVKLLTDLLASAADGGRHQAAVLDQVKKQLPVFVFSCLQLASKLSLHGDAITNTAAVHFLRSVGITVSTKTLVESEVTILKALDFRLNPPNPLMYVEVLLEVLGNNEPGVRVEQLYDLCLHVLQLIRVDRASVYQTLLETATQSGRPSAEQREKFVAVTEDYMLLGVGVISVATYILSFSQWEEVATQLTYITGISGQSIHDFTRVVLLHVVGPSPPAQQLEPQ